MKILKYSEYKSKQALWLQTLNFREYGIIPEIMYLYKYLQYLDLVDRSKKDVVIKIRDYISKIEKYEQNVNHENINYLVDELIKPKNNLLKRILNEVHRRTKSIY